MSAAHEVRSAPRSVHKPKGGCPYVAWVADRLHFAVAGVTTAGTATGTSLCFAAPPQLARIGGLGNLLRERWSTRIVLSDSDPINDTGGQHAHYPIP